MNKTSLDDRERIAREGLRADRLAKVRHAQGFFGPELATGVSDPQYLQGIRKDGGGISEAQGGKDDPANSQNSENTKNQNEQNPRTSSNTISASDRATTLLEALEVAIVRNDAIAIVEIIDQSAQVIKELGKLKENQVSRNRGETVDNDGENALRSVMTRENDLMQAKTEAEREEDDLPSHQSVVVEDYQYSEGHDAMVMIASQDNEATRYPIDSMDDVPEIGNRVTMHWNEGRASFDDYGPENQNNQSRQGERVMGAA